MATAHDVAKYFLHLDEVHDGEGISNLKLQKLAYYAQGFHCAIYSQALFENTIEAWTHGPVIPDLYHEYKQFGKAAINVQGEVPACLTDKERELIDEVYEVFGQFSAWKLRNMTHEEAPWINNEETAGTITVPELTEYFSTRVQ